MLMQNFGVTNKEHYNVMVFCGVVNTRYPSHYCLLYYQQTFSSIVAIYHENDGEISGGVTKCCLFSYLSFFFGIPRFRI